MKDWKEEFYKRFGHIQAIKNEKSGNSYDRVVDYIDNLLSQQRKEVLEEIIEELEEYLNNHGFSDEEDVPDFNPGYQVEYFKVLKIIKSLINKQ